MHPARTTRRITVVGLTAVSLALAGATALPALADPPAGHGNGNPPSQPPGQVKQSPSPTPTATKTNNGKAKGNGHGHSGVTGKTNGQGNNGTGSGHNPPGNNGTVKIHAVPGDTSHHNVAHPGCSFVVDFWGFDAGQTLTVSFTGQAPTGMGTPVSFTALDGTSITSPDPAGGGNDPDGELQFMATPDELSVLGAPAHEGYHVRLTVDTGQGGGHKYKVFWLGPCAPAVPTVVTPTPTASGPQLINSHPTVVGDTLTGSRQVRADTPQLDSARDTVSTPRLLEASPPVSSLPFTGADIVGVVVAGSMLLAAGTVLVLGARRRRKIG